MPLPKGEAWFAPKGHGILASIQPVRQQGRVVMVVAKVGFFVGVICTLVVRHSFFLTIYMGALCGALMFVWWLKGEPMSWRWRKD